MVKLFSVLHSPIDLVSQVYLVFARVLKEDWFKDNNGHYGITYGPSNGPFLFMIKYLNTYFSKGRVPIT